mgnify:CR=1 FL=1
MKTSPASGKSASLATTALHVVGGAAKFAIIVSLAGVVTTLLFKLDSALAELPARWAEDPGLSDEDVADEPVGVVGGGILGIVYLGARAWPGCRRIGGTLFSAAHQATPLAGTGDVFCRRGGSYVCHLAISMGTPAKSPV